MKKLTTLLFVLVFASSMAFAQNNNASIDQTNDLNDATVTQTGMQNQTNIVQSTEASIIGGPDSYTEANVEQTGDQNAVDLDQDAFYGFSDVTINQEGDENYAGLLTQNGGGHANINMDGNGNWLSGLNGLSQAVQKNNNNNFYLDVMGDDNGVQMNQEGAHADVILEGSGNFVKLRQKNSGYTTVHTALINVNGGENNINVDQSALDENVGGTNNYTDINLLNNSSMNSVTVGQYGSHHIADVTVDGSSNTATITQNGAGSMAE